MVLTRELAGNDVANNKLCELYVCVYLYVCNSIVFVFVCEIIIHTHTHTYIYIYIYM